MLSFSKGLGCPVGAILVGDRETITRAHPVRKRLGGGMRQSGILAAAALYALDAHMTRLSEDHANASLFAIAVDGAAGARVVPPDTNIVMIDLSPRHRAADVVRAVKAKGVLISEWSPTRLRMVTHLDVSADQARFAAETVREVLLR
jgi:threonine aldolase